jgi:hypothetical protein
MKTQKRSKDLMKDLVLSTYRDGWNDATSRAAKIAESHTKSMTAPPDFRSGQEFAAKAIAKEIRQDKTRS